MEISKHFVFLSINCLFLWCTEYIKCSVHLMYTSTSKHKGKFLVCVNIIGNKPDSDFDCDIVK